MKNIFEKISVVGLGYIGLPTAALLASRGLEVVGVDINLATVDTINQGKIHIVEPDLEALVHKMVSNGHLRAVLTPEAADAFLITVPTPFKHNHEPDLSYVEKAVESIASHLKRGDLVILESTSPLGTTLSISQRLASLRLDLIFPHQNENNADIAIAYCPERVMPGQILRELVDNDRIIGGMSQLCSLRAKALYDLFVRGECVMTNAKTAEMVKLTENAYRDVNIAFANELSVICDKVDIDVWELIKLANRHPRVDVLQPGAGVGGHCIAVDPWFIVNAAPYEARLIRAAREVNDAKPYYVVEKIKALAREQQDPKIALLGLTYKANTDDLRESPALIILETLALQTDYQINIVEPNITQLPAQFADNRQVNLVSLEEALQASNVIVPLVAHQEFKTIESKILQDKTMLQVTQIEEHEVIAASSRFGNQTRPVSEYGRMMMNKIYGLIP